MKKKIAIIGAGIAGLTFANLIKEKSDFEFMIYEKEDGLSLEDGFGIQLSVNSVSTLKLILNIDPIKIQKIKIIAIAPKKPNSSEIKVKIKSVCFSGK